MAAAICMASIALVGCGSSALPSTSPSSAAVSLAGTPAERAALDKLLAETSGQVDRLKSTFANLYRDIKMTGDYPDTLVVTYTFHNAVDPATGAPRIASQAPVLDAACKTDFFPEMTAAGITQPQARLVWLNPDGSQVATYECKK